MHILTLSFVQTPINQSEVWVRAGEGSRAVGVGESCGGGFVCMSVTERENARYRVIFVCFNNFLILLQQVQLI